MIQTNIISKQYPDFDENKLKIHLRTDEDLIISGSTELQDLYEDSVSFVEKQIQKDVAVTLKEYKFFDFAGDTVIVDEGNYISVSAITYTSAGVEYSITAFSVSHDKNKIVIKLPASLDISNTNYLKILLFTGYQTIPKNIRRAVYIICTDMYYSERGSYTVTNNHSNVIDRLLASETKYWHNFSI
jgi:hypothetical protein